MVKLSNSNSKTSKFLALLMSATTIIPMMPLIPATAQPASTPRRSTVVQRQIAVPRGTQIAVRHEDAKKIVVSRDETMPVTLQVALNITDNNGTVLIPAGSEIIGQVEPAGNGSQFVAQELVINENQRYYLDATSRVVTKTETISGGANTEDILKGTLAGAGAATIIAGVTGNRRIEPLEILGGAAVGTLAGWALPETGVLGGSRKEVISINPNQDLTLTLESPLTVGTRVNPNQNGRYY
ncbi:conserved hypothetical protein [Gloeothece citriformis PCC 7424]|uniref:S-layer domain protein n=1 Tax=Gloeothece citriformis (strain PCC 7424) TaxID=65393 RepID=B7KAX6_GLOC7|nr:hypothetical protein [Gloeothece citriformis]ACK70086.1 conserved hypothetical protein [Gloeothece citriformis PCC 7424]